MDTKEFFPFEERVVTGETSDFYPCDLCDETNVPMVSWHCTHDDPAHVTHICLECVNRLNRLPVMHTYEEEKFEENRTDPYQKEF